MSSESKAPADQVDLGELIGAIATNRDRAAFATLFEHFAPKVKAFMQRSGLDDGRAEELAQETMLAVWRKAPLFDRASVGGAAWIFTIARNLRIDAWRREQRGGGANLAQVDLEFQVDDQPLPDSQVDAAHTEVKLRSAIAMLSADQSRVVELSFFQDKAHPEIAASLGIPLGTVKSRLRLAMSRLRTLLREPS